MNEIIVLTREQLQDVIREAVLLASKDLVRRVEHQTVSEVMTLGSLAKYLQVSKSTIVNLMKRGLPHVRVGADPRFYKSQIDQWLKNQ